MGSRNDACESGHGDQLDDLGGKGDENCLIKPLGGCLGGGEYVAPHVVVMLAAVYGDDLTVPYDIFVFFEIDAEIQ